MLLPATSPRDQRFQSDFENILHPDEKLLWMGRPKLAPYALSASMEPFTVALFLGFSYMIVFNNQKNLGAGPTTMALFFALLIAVVLFRFIRRLLSYKNTGYAFSTSQIFIRTGFPGTTYKVIPRDKIQETLVDVSIIEGFFNTGSIRFFSGATKLDEGSREKVYDSWEGIPTPEEVLKLLETTRPSPAGA